MGLPCRAAVLHYPKRISDINLHDPEAAPVISEAILQDIAAAAFTTCNSCEQCWR